MVAATTSIIQALDSRRSLKQTTDISRLTYLALSFIPLTFVSGLLSMNEKILTGGKVFYIYFAVAAPLCLVVFAIALRPDLFLAMAPAINWSWRSIKRQDLVISRKSVDV